MGQLRETYKTRWVRSGSRRALFEVVLYRRASEDDSARAVEGQECSHGVAAVECLEAVALVTHEQLNVVLKIGAVLLDVLVGRDEDAPLAACLEACDLHAQVSPDEPADTR